MNEKNNSMPDAEQTESPRVLETRRRILEAALEEFSAHGYSGATTRGIADRAGVSELTLFRHFQSKKNVFLSVVSQFSAIHGIQTAIEENFSGNIRQDLTRIGGLFLRTLLERRKEILMTLREAEIFPEVREATAAIPGMLRNLTAGYLQKQMDTGRIKKGNANLAAQAFLGLFFSYATYLSLDQAATVDQPDQIVAAFVDIFLDGVLSHE